ncbi:Gfo/Idh/MocA family protein [Streptomyces sp. NPDC001796]|uniref:Gfo/Idh/MocA family protein n=1 Tax=Streptomyces sp. NPDC001796 TaxID=3364609 RepID=UPI00369E4ECD
MTPASGPVVRLGLMGCADIALRRVLPAVARLPRLSLTAVASRDRERAERVTAVFGGRAVADYEQLLDREDVDAVYVPLPTGLHAEWVGRALAAGKHVLAEKPLTTDPAATEALVTQARAAGLVLHENFMFLHHRRQHRVRALLDSGAIGELRSFSAAFAIPPRDRSDIRYQAALGGGARLDVGAYPVRAALYFLGPGTRVVGSALRHEEDPGVDVAGGALVNRPDGVVGQLVFGLDHAYTSRYELLGTEGRITVDRAFTPPADHTPVVRLERGGGVEELVLEPDDQCANTLAAFADAVLRGRTCADPSLIRQAQLLDDVRRLAVVTAAHGAGASR